MRRKQTFFSVLKYQLRDAAVRHLSFVFANQRKSRRTSLWQSHIKFRILKSYIRRPARKSSLCLEPRKEKCSIRRFWRDYGNWWKEIKKFCFFWFSNISLNVEVSEGRNFLSSVLWKIPPAGGHIQQYGYVSCSARKGKHSGGCATTTCRQSECLSNKITSKVQSGNRPSQSGLW